MYTVHQLYTRLPISTTYCHSIDVCACLNVLHSEVDALLVPGAGELELQAIH